MMSIRNKKGINLITLIIAIVLIVILITTIVISSNNSITTGKSTNIYNLDHSLLKFKYNGGFVFQTGASVSSYLGISIGSFFDEDIKNDMDAINWNMFNIDEKAVLDSEKVSFYKGVPVFRFNYNRSGSFLAIFLTKGIKSTNTVRHEWGHNVQQLILGPIYYGLCIGLPSALQWSNRSYYDRPWEITADIFGEVTSRKHSESDILRGYSYLDISAMFGILAYSFIPNEY